MTDIDYEALDPGIREVVRWLRENGFNTTDSGDGTKVDMGCAFDMPMVAMVCERAGLLDEADRLWRLLRAQVPAQAHEAHVEATYDPTDRTAILLLLRLSDRMLPWT